MHVYLTLSVQLSIFLHKKLKCDKVSGTDKIISVYVKLPSILWLRAAKSYYYYQCQQVHVAQTILFVVCFIYLMVISSLNTTSWVKRNTV